MLVPGRFGVDAGFEIRRALLSASPAPAGATSGVAVPARLREPQRGLGLGRQLGAALDELERRARLIHELEQLQILGREGAVAHQSLEVDHFFPERRTVEEHGNRTLELAGLRQRQDLEQLVERAEAAGKRNQGARQVREPQLAHEEVVELEAELRGDIGIGTLLLRQTDVEADAA